MKISVLSEDTSISGLFNYEHGLSLFIEHQDQNILFDTGKSSLFMENAQKLQIDLSECQICAISHGHYDHLGGLIDFMKFNGDAGIYLKREIFESQYYSKKGNLERLIGYSSELPAYKERFIYCDGACSIKDQLIFIGQFDINYPLPKGNNLLLKKSNKFYAPDDFSHELVLAIDTSDGLVIFTGCAHHGILNIINTTKTIFPGKRIHSVIGGFHLIDTNEFVQTETEKDIHDIGEELVKLCPSAIFYTGHCTGIHAFKYLAEVMGHRIHKLKTGQIIEF
jgi:7,8-dihydropterin-6-yl-methyl-4-(beta-D-ribofuranosyl)aminobenzene 5'-phosphate synthase